MKIEGLIGVCGHGEDEKNLRWGDRGNTNIIEEIYKQSKIGVNI